MLFIQIIAINVHNIPHDKAVAAVAASKKKKNNNYNNMLEQSLGADNLLRLA